MKKYLAFVLALSAVGAAHAEDDSFGDLPDLTKDALPVEKPPVKNNAKPEKKIKAKAKPVETVPADEPTPEIFENVAPPPSAAVTDETPPPTTAADPVPSTVVTTPEKAVSTMDSLTRGESDLPADVKELEKQIEGAQSLAPNLLNEGDPGTKLKPSEQFYRVPLKPRTSDASWRKWVGPQLEKTYKIRKGDTLWGISERLFGNPYLWPKVWQLNAQVTNPNEISAGIELMFTPGNANSAPELAFKNYRGTSTEELPVMMSEQKLSFMERIERVLQTQSESADPPFKFFMFANKPESVGQVAPLDKDERMLYSEGQYFQTKAPPGTYAVIRYVSQDGAYKIRWLGEAVVDTTKGKISRSFSEIHVDDLLVNRSFVLSPLALHEETLSGLKASLVPLEEGVERIASEHRLIGVKFPSVEKGPRPGAIMKISRGFKEIATLLLIDRSEKVGTFWVIDNTREIDLLSDRLD